MTLPTIGITLDSEEPGGYSAFPCYADPIPFNAFIEAARS